MQIILVEEDHLEKWDKFVLQFDTVGPMHYSGWFKILNESFAVDPIYLMAVNNDEVLGVLPLYESKSIFFGNHLTTLDGGALSNHPNIEELLYNEAIRLATEKKLDYFLVRNSKICDLLPQESFLYVHTVIKLSSNDSDIWNGLTSNMRRKIRKAKKNGFSIEEGPQNLPYFYKCYARNMRVLGTPVFGKGVFSGINKYLHQRIRLFIVKYEENVIGGMLTISTRDLWTSLYVAVDKEVQHLYPTYLLYWEVIKYACLNNIRYLDLGRSIPNSGNHRFKSQWLGIEQFINYNFYFAKSIKDLPNKPIADETKLMNKVWQHTPLFFTNLLGPILRRQIPFG